MSLNDIADFQRKIHDFKMDVTRHLEMMAAAYMKATDIPPEECELVVETLPDKMVYRFQRRPTKRVPDVAKSGDGKSKNSGKRSAKSPRR
jgi:hypothetical protein